MMGASLRKWNIRFGLGLPPSTGMREALNWLMLARLAVLYLLLGSVIVPQVFKQHSLTDTQLELAYGLLALSFAFNLFFSQLIERIPGQWWVAAIHVIFDALVTSAWILFSGEKESLFSLLYLIQILLVALILYQKGAWFSAIVACVCFAVVNFHHDLANPSAFLNWITYSAIFLTVGAVGGYLSEELLRTSQSLKDKQQKIERLTVLHERIISNLPTGLLTVDRQMRINFINPAAEHIIDKTASQCVGLPLETALPGLQPFFAKMESDLPEGERDSLRHSARQMEASLYGNRSEALRSLYVQTHGDSGKARLQQRVEYLIGTQRKVLRGDVASLDAEAGLGKLLDQEAAGGRVLLFQDVTKISHLEEKLKQNEKLAAVGQLAAGIAHEIRNPLASMSASIEMLKGSLPTDGAYLENQKLMDIAIREIDRLNRLVTEFLDFVKPEKLKFQTVNLKDLILELVDGIRRQKNLKHAIHFAENFSGELLALANPEKIKQVALNLLVNAVQAMDKSGEVEVGCGPAGPGKVKFWVADSGVGMSEEVLAHLYEPFFTTKEKGTGLGLATAYKIIEAHRGEILVTSKVNHGTRFEVILQVPS